MSRRRIEGKSCSQILPSDKEENERSEVNRPTEGIAVDAFHSAKHGVTRYRGVDLRTGVELFHEDLGNQTVNRRCEREQRPLADYAEPRGGKECDSTLNIGEFLGVVAAVKYIIKRGHTPRVVYTDSLVAIAWFNGKRTASKRKTPALFKAEVFLQAMAARVATIRVVHWNKEAWGEIPADYGLK